MARESIVIGSLLIVVGVGGYALSGAASPTALIPVAFGVVIAVMGVYGRSPSRRKAAMHIAMGVALVGIIGTIGGLVTTVRHLLAPTEGGLGLAPISKTVMAVLLIIYLARGVRSFINARRDGT